MAGAATFFLYLLAIYIALFAFVRLRVILYTYLYPSALMRSHLHVYRLFPTSVAIFFVTISISTLDAAKWVESGCSIYSCTEYVYDITIISSTSVISITIDILKYISQCFSAAKKCTFQINVYDVIPIVSLYFIYYIRNDTYYG